MRFTRRRLLGLMAGVVPAAALVGVGRGAPRPDALLEAVAAAPSYDPSAMLRGAQQVAQGLIPYATYRAEMGGGQVRTRLREYGEWIKISDLAVTVSASTDMAEAARLLGERIGRDRHAEAMRA